MTNDTQTAPATSKTTQSTSRQQEVEQQQSYSPAEKAMVTELRRNIDRRGNFTYKLEDYILAYSAGKNITEFEAEKQIRQMFEKEVGMDIKAYHEKDRVAKGKDVDQDR